jgi:hypothetical protein
MHSRLLNRRVAHSFYVHRVVDDVVCYRRKIRAGFIRMLLRVFNRIDLGPVYTSADNPFDQACLSTIWELPLPAAGNGHCVLRDVSFTYVQYRGDQRPKPNAAQRMGAIGSDVEF